MLIGITATSRNGPLLQYRIRERVNQREAAERAGIAHSKWNALERMRFQQIGWQAIQDVADLLGCHVDAICPQELKRSDCRLTRTAFKKIDMSRMLNATGGNRLILPDPSDVIADAEEHAAEMMRVNAAMNNLTSRQREIIKLRYGLNGEPALMWEPIAQMFNVSHQRVRQIAEQALHKIRASVKKRGETPPGFLEDER